MRSIGRLAGIVAFSIILTSSARAQSVDIQPRPNEKLRDYIARMDAGFAPEIAKHGIEELAKEEGSDYARYRKFLNQWMPRAFRSNSFADALALEQNGYRRSNIAAKTATQVLSDPWEELGPREKPQTHVGAEGTGPITSMTFYPPSPSHMLCGSSPGGLFYTTNGGATWSSTGTDTETGPSGVSSEVFSPNDYHTWFVSSSGNGAYEPSWIGWSGGVYRTVDEGATWTRIADQTTFSAGFWTRIFKLLIDPANPNRLFAATSSGLYRTNNAMAAAPVWTQVAALGNSYVYDINFRPGSSTTMYAALATTSGGTWSFKYTTNLNTWQDVPGQLPITAGAVRLVLEVSPANASNLYCLVIPPGGSPSKLYIYDFIANQWNLVNGSAHITAAGTHAFAVDPFNANTIYLSESTEARRYDYQGTPPYTDFHSSYYTGGMFHPDVEVLVAHPLTPGTVYMGEHGGVVETIDKGVTWFDRSNGIAASEITHFADATADASHILAGLSHDGSVETATAYSPLWAPLWREVPNSFCDGGRAIIEPVSTTYQQTSCQWGAFYGSSDGGLTFAPLGPSSLPFVAEEVVNAAIPATQFRVVNVAGHVNVIRTTDRWVTTQTQISHIENLYTGPTYFIWKLYISTTHPDTLVAHIVDNQTWTNKLYRTQNANAPSPVWVELPMPDNNWIADLDFDPVDPNIVYIANSSSAQFVNNATGSKMLFRVDYTNPSISIYNTCVPAVCTDLTQNLPNTTMGQDTLAIEPNSNGGIYLGTDAGVWYSTEASRASGSGWTQLGSNFPHTRSSDVAINAISSTVRAGTDGRGMWLHDLVPTTLGACAQPPQNMTGWWKMEMVPNVDDVADLNDLGHAINAPTVVPGVVHNAIRFNGTSQYVDVPNSAQLDVGAGDFSIDAWVRTTATGIQPIVDKRSSVPRGYLLYINNGRLGLQMGDRNGSAICSNNPTSACTNFTSPFTWPNIADGKWHHVAASVTRNSTTGGRLYVDGWVVLTFNPTIRNLSLTNAAHFWIARDHFSSNGYFKGDIDEVELFQSAITTADVRAIYNAGSFGKCFCVGCQ